MDANRLTSLTAQQRIAPKDTKAKGTEAKDTKAWKTAVDFEAQFLKSMLEQAYAGVQGEGPMGNSGPGGDAWRGFLLDEHAKAMTARGGIGLADQVYRDILKMKGGSHAQ